MKRPRLRHTPSSIGENGRDAQGRFTKGNAGGPGNPFIHRVAALRSALLEEVRPDDIRRVIRRMVKQAVRGDVAAAKVLLERCIGRVPDNLMVEVQRTADRIEEMARKARQDAMEEELFNHYR